VSPNQGRQGASLCAPTLNRITAKQYGAFIPLDINGLDYGHKFCTLYEEMFSCLKPLLLPDELFPNLNR